MDAQHTPGAAAKLQADREAAELANHRERVVWLSADRPKWADGELVDNYTRRVLLLQSRAAIAKAAQSGERGERE